MAGTTTDRWMRTGRRPTGPAAQAHQPRARPALCERVVADLERLWSPEQIARRLRAEFPDDPEMWVSHETIYQSMFVQGRGELRRELAACLRTGRAKRRPRGRLDKRGRIPDMVMICERPAEAEDRAVPGHWEGDLIIGKNSSSAIGTLVERSTRFVMLLHLPEGPRRRSGAEAITAAIPTLPAALRRSLTWDQGIEMAEHAASASTPASPSTSATPTRPGSAAPTRTPTASCASTSPRAPTCRSTAPTTSKPPPTASTADLARPSDG